MPTVARLAVTVGGGAPGDAEPLALTRLDGAAGAPAPAGGVASLLQAAIGGSCGSAVAGAGSSSGGGGGGKGEGGGGAGQRLLRAGLVRWAATHAQRCAETMPPPPLGSLGPPPPGSLGPRPPGKWSTAHDGLVGDNQVLFSVVGS